MREKCEVCKVADAYKHHEGYGFLCDDCAMGLNLFLPPYTAYFAHKGHYYDPVVTK